MTRRRVLKCLRTGLVLAAVGVGLVDLASVRYGLLLRTQAHAASISQGRLRLSVFDPLEVRPLSSEEFRSHSMDIFLQPTRLSLVVGRDLTESLAIVGPSAHRGIVPPADATSLRTVFRSPTTGASLISTIQLRLWWIWLAVAASGVALLFVRTRYPIGHCSRCGYDLRATPKGLACPECGIGH
jgi:hypothetical protein